ncbi:interferon alpha-inducible protein 27-like protein 1 [Clytia hemisphaerica]|uniref:interferon alpha-inducible protein 27-like protein 1 n=1 Tax=Clytia hemisphaerica TaxID=252671 RepID=UPI0034D5863D
MKRIFKTALICFAIPLTAVTVYKLQQNKKQEVWSLQKKEESRLLYKAGGAVIGGVFVILAGPAVLSALGFTSAGIAASSLAAGIQSAFYGAATTGAFSVFQSAGVSGLGIFSKCALGMTGGIAGNYLGEMMKKKEEPKKWNEFDLFGFLIRVIRYIASSIYC